MKFQKQELIVIAMMGLIGAFVNFSMGVYMLLFMFSFLGGHKAGMYAYNTKKDRHFNYYRNLYSFFSFTLMGIILFILDKTIGGFNQYIITIFVIAVVMGVFALFNANKRID